MVQFYGVLIDSIFDAIIALLDLSYRTRVFRQFSPAKHNHWVLYTILIGIDFEIPS